MPTVGYIAHFEYINGFEKTLYWTADQMMAHADKYSPAFSAKAYQKLLNGEIPQEDMWKYSSFWYKDFDGMAKKTMLRQLISKWGMDDLVLFGRRWADIQSAARKLTKWALTELGLTIKNEWVRVDFLSAAEEHQRRHLTGAAKGCPGLDMAGYVMHRTYTTIRPRIFLRARRQYIRAKADVAQKGYVPVWRSYKLVSYNGYFDWTKSRAISETLKQKKLFTAAKVAIRVTAQRNAMKKVRIAA